MRAPRLLPLACLLALASASLCVVPAVTSARGSSAWRSCPRRLDVSDGEIVGVRARALPCRQAYTRINHLPRLVKEGVRRRSTDRGYRCTAPVNNGQGVQITCVRGPRAYSFITYLD